VSAVRAAAQYWAVIFGLGFAFGTARTLWLAPLWVTERAILAELPPMLLASALSANHLLRRHRLVRPRDAAAMGALAFALLIASEGVLAVTVTGQTMQAWAAATAEVPGLYGLAGQIAFGVLPGLLAAARRRRA